jgi:hypothetical protein
MLNENRRRNSSSACRTYLTSPPFDDFAPKDSFDALVASALTIIEGHVISTDKGFLNGVPGTLASLRINETYKSLGRLATKGNIHVFVGEATLPTKTTLICSKTLSMVPVPQVGDDVIVFASIDPLDAERRILVIDERKQLMVQRLGRVYRPLSSSETDLWPAGCCSDFKELGFRLRENKHLHDAPVRLQQ